MTRQTASPTGGAAESAVVYPAASASSPLEAADELAETFEMLGDRDAKNEFVLDLGAKLPHYFDMLKKVTPRIPGCMSEVYLVGRRVAADEGL